MIFKNFKLTITFLSSLSIALLFVLIFGVYDICAKNKKTSELLNLADNASELDIIAQSVRMLQKESSEDIKVFENFVLTEDKLVPLIEDIEDTGRTLGLETTILSVGNVDKTGSNEPQIIHITMETKGSWSGALSFLQAVESLPYRVQIDETNLFKEESDWKSRIILSLYLFN